MLTASSGAIRPAVADAADTAVTMWSAPSARWRRPAQAHVDIDLDPETAYEETRMWRSEGGAQSIGGVTLLRLSETLTRVQITASGRRVSRRALESDLLRLKAFIALRDAEGELDELEPPRPRAPR